MGFRGLSWHFRQGCVPLVGSHGISCHLMRLHVSLGAFMGLRGTSITLLLCTTGKGLHSCLVSRLLVPRRSTVVEVHPDSSEAPHLKSTLSHPKNGLRGKNEFLPDENSRGPSIQNHIFRNKIDVPTILGGGGPSFRNKKAEMCYLYRRKHLP